MIRLGWFRTDKNEQQTKPVEDSRNIALWWPWLLAVLLLGIGLVWRLGLAWLPVPLLIEKSLPDDAFYYFTVARNTVGGRGISFDGLTATNGFHPLWWAVILLPYAVAPQGNLPINLALTLSAAADVLAAGIGFYLIWGYTRQVQAGLLFLLLYLFNPMVLLEAVNGLETAISVLFLALTCYIYVVHLYRQEGTVGQYALLGLAAGLTMLGRTDNLFLIGMIGLHLLWQGRRQPGKTAGRLAAAAGVGVVVLSPWLGWNLATFGTIVQSSAVAVPEHTRLLMRTNLEAGVPWADIVTLTYGKTSILTLFYTFRYAGLALCLMPTALILRRLNRPGPLQPGSIPLTPALVIFVGAALPLLVHALIRVNYRTWYFVPISWAGALLAAVFVARLLASWQPGRVLKTLVVGALVLILAVQNVRQTDLYHWQREMYAAALWLATDLPPEAVPASFNSGILAYYGQHRMVNLDGVVNWEAIAAFKQRRLLAYMASQGVTHLIDYDDYVYNLFFPAFEEGYQDRLVPLQTVVDAGSNPEFGGNIVIYKLEPEKRSAE